jgi:hypothetical protein
MPDRGDIDWGRVFVEAVTIAVECTTSVVDAEELVMEGMQLVLQRKAPWDPATSKHETLAEHLVAVGYNAVRNQRRKWGRHRKPEIVSKIVHALEARRTRTPEQDALVAEEVERKKRLFEKLLSQTETDDPDVHAVALLEQQEVDEPAEQAQELGWDIGRLRNARKRLKRRAHELAEQAEKDDKQPNRQATP